MKIHVGDKVRLIAGKDKGKDGVVERVYLKQNKVLIGGLNQYKRHMKKSEQFPQGGVIDVPRPVDSSKVMLIASDGKSTTRVGYVVEGGKKFRFEKKTGERLKVTKK
jgi:large subunit ribosomal protein L24